MSTTGTTGLTDFFTEYSRTDWGPLTSVFTPPAACFQVVHDGLSEGELYFVYGQSCSLASQSLSTLVKDPKCFPFTPLLISSTGFTIPASEEGPVYTPGQACPEGFTTACKITRGTQITPELLNPTLWPLWRLLGEGETGYGCCQSDFSCALHPASCVASTPITTSATYISYDSSCSVSTGTGTFVVSATQPQFLLVTSQSVDDGPSGLALSFGAEIAIAIRVSIATVMFVLGCCFLGRKGVMLRPVTRRRSDSEPKLEDSSSIPLTELERETARSSLSEDHDNASVALSVAPSTSLRRRSDDS
ncbi:uncharacterized protein BDV14DRAFT_204031 [Aspergillus stella-maris]|uniref:uncharacterized protein n=1 Tax=Aspergillus stella-maris TaxID=1810926 RepID=UPI003CCD78A9